MKKTDDKQQVIVSDRRVEELEKQLERAHNEMEDWKAKCMRALADYQNLERRNREEKDEVRKFAGEVILGKMLSAIDTLLRAKEHLKDAGLDLAYKEFSAVLQEQGVEKIQTQGEQFDPHQMECIEVVGGENNTVVEELLPGYRFHGKILRVAQVKVGKNNK